MGEGENIRDILEGVINETIQSKNMGTMSPIMNPLEAMFLLVTQIAE